MASESIAGSALAQSSGRFRPEIQALRALAIALVLVYHLWPNYLTGGFIGVDVFFVISGFLITSHLVRDATSERGPKLSAFYARRARRLLPASLLVLMLLALITLLAVPQTLWQSYFSNIFASAFYFENWSLAASSVDYLAAGTGTIPVQHFWSLSVEEQFYLVWPVVILVCFLIARKAKGSTRRNTLFALSSIAVLSLVVSVVWTANDQQVAFFATPTRAWEFAAGGLISFVPVAILSDNPGVKAALSWLGLAIVFASALVMNADTLFPGWVAVVPVVGTALVIFAGFTTHKFSPSPLYGSRPIQFFGKISYSLYLWHWPLIIMVPLILGQPLSVAAKVVVAVVSVGVAWLSKLFLEDRFVLRKPDSTMTNQKLARQTRFTLVATFAAMAAVGAVCVPPLLYTDQRVAAANVALADAIAAQPACFGALAIADSSCTSTIAVEDVVPSPLIARQDVSQQGCQQSSSRVEVLRCEFGVPNGIKVALIGDSHTTQWLPVLQELSTQRGWNLTTFLRSGCSLGVSDTSQIGSAGKCAQWGQSVIRQLQQEHFNYVFLSGRNYWISSPDSKALSERAGEYADAWAEIQQTGAKVVVIKDTPQPVAGGLADPATCVFKAASTTDCGFPQAKGVGSVDPIALGAKKLNGIAVLDMTSYFCRTVIEVANCPAVIGGVLVYRDPNHMTATYSRTLLPYFEAQLPETVR